MDQRDATTKRLDLSPAAVTAAKRAFVIRTGDESVDINSKEDLEEIYFREVVDYAVGEFGGRLERELLKIGLVNREIKPRQRPVTIATWDGVLERMTKKFDLSKIQILRCLLEMLAASEGQQVPLPSEE